MSKIIKMHVSKSQMSNLSCLVVLSFLLIVSEEEFLVLQLRFLKLSFNFKKERVNSSFFCSLVLVIVIAN